MGRFWWDLWYFSINTNPILALCLSHPLHPVGRKERYAISAMQVRSEPSRSPFVLALSCTAHIMISNVRTMTQVLFLMIVACGLSEAQVRPRAPPSAQPSYPADNTTAQAPEADRLGCVLRP